MDRQPTLPLGEVIQKLVKTLGLEGELERYEIFNAWDEAVGVRAARSTTSKYFKDGILYCTLNSSVLRSALFPRLEQIRMRMNTHLTGTPVEKIILK